MLAFKNLKPLLNRVVIRKAEKVTKTAGGILLPEDKAQQLNFGTVVAVGPGRKLENGEVKPVDLKEGDVVLLPEYGGTKVVLAEEKEVYLYRDDDILGTLHDPTK